MTSAAEQKSVEKTLQKEIKDQRMQIKQLESKIKTVQSELTKSNLMKDRLEGLCRELQKQNKYIKVESFSKIQEANEKGRELATEVQNNKGFMRSINENLAAITNESLNVKLENEELSKKINLLKDNYDQREELLQSALQETKEALLLTKKECEEVKIKNVEEKKKLYEEMQGLAGNLIQSRDSLQEAKQTEIELRNILKSYDDKFNLLQKSLKSTNNSYEDFKNEMNRISERTKELEVDSTRWRSRWQESHNALTQMEKNHQKMQEELKNANESLLKMTNLCRALQTERKTLLEEIKQKSDKKAEGNEVAEKQSDEAGTGAAEDAKEKEITLTNGSAGPVPTVPEPEPEPVERSDNTENGQSLTEVKKV